MSFFKNLFSGPKASDITISAPVQGECVPLKNVSDPTFAEELLGKGAAIHPSKGRVVAPIDAQVDNMFATGHAVSLVADCGTAILIHIGMDTVNLKGKYFEARVRTGDRVKKGDVLIEFEMDNIVKAGYDIITPVVICNSEEYMSVKALPGAVAEGEPIISLWK